MGPKNKKGGSKAGPAEGVKKDKSTTGSKKDQKKEPPYPVWEHEAQIKFRLSDEAFLVLGWTAPPEERHLKTIVTYRSRPSKPHMTFFKRRDKQEIRYYPDGTKMVVLNKNGTGTVYYPGGRIAIVRQKSHRCARTLVFSPGGVEPRTGNRRTPTVCAIFDSIGNGVVYNEDGKIRLNFTQKHGVLLDTPNGLPRKWTWPIKFDNESTALSTETMSKPLPPDPPQEESRPASSQVQRGSKDNKNKKSSRKAKTKMSTASIKKTAESESSRSRKNKMNTSSESISRDNRANSATSRESVKKFEGILEEVEELEKVIEEPEIVNIREHMNFVKNFKKDHTEVRTPIKPICMPLSEFLTLRICDQANVNLVFRAYNQTLRIEMGVLVDPTEHIRVDKVDPKTCVANDGLMNFFEQFPRKSMTKLLERLGRQRERSVLKMIQRRKVDAIMGKTVQLCA